MHHRFGGRGALLGAVTEAGWVDAEEFRIDSVVSVEPDSLWPWLWRALPIQRAGGPYLDQAEREPYKETIRARLIERCALDLDTDGCYRFAMAAWMVSARRGADDRMCACLTTEPRENPAP